MNKLNSHIKCDNNKECIIYKDEKEEIPVIKINISDNDSHIVKLTSMQKFTNLVIEKHGLKDKRITGEEMKINLVQR